MQQLQQRHPDQDQLRSPATAALPAGGGPRQSASEHLHALDGILDNALSGNAQEFNERVAQTVGE